MKVGRYGRYLETEIEKDKTKRVSVPKNVPNEDIDLAKSVKLLTLPRDVGTHPVSKKQITASIGPYGPYLKHENKFVSLKEDDVTEIGINRAVELIDKKMLEIREIIVGNHPVTKKKIVKKKGIKGRSDYISYNKKNYPIPKDLSDKDLSLDQAIKIIDEKKDKKKSN